MRCTQADELLDPYFDGELAPAMRKGFEDHLAACPACQEGLAGRTRLGVELGRLPVPPVPLGGPDRVVAALPPLPGARAFSWRGLGGLARPLAAAGLGATIFGAYMLGTEAFFDWQAPEVGSGVDARRLEAMRPFAQLIRGAFDDIDHGRKAKAKEKLAAAKRLAAEGDLGPQAQEQLARVGYWAAGGDSNDRAADRAETEARVEGIRRELSAKGAVPGARLVAGQGRELVRIRELIELEARRAQGIDNHGDRAGALAVVEAALPWIETVELSGEPRIEIVKETYLDWGSLLGYRSDGPGAPLWLLLRELAGPAREEAERRKLIARAEAGAGADPVAAVVAIEARRELVDAAKDWPGFGPARVLAERRLVAAGMDALDARNDLAELEVRAGYPGLMRQVALERAAARARLAWALIGTAGTGAPAREEARSQVRALLAELPGVPTDWERASRSGFGWGVCFTDLASLYQDLVRMARQLSAPELEDAALDAAARHLGASGPEGALAAAAVVLTAVPEAAPGTAAFEARLAEAEAGLARCLAAADQQPGAQSSIRDGMHKVARETQGQLAAARAKLAGGARPPR